MRLANYLFNNKLKIYKFIFVGFITYLLNNILFWYFVNIFNIQYQISLSLSYFTTVVCHFLAHKYLTFQDNGIKKIPINLSKYLLLLSLNYVITLCIVTVVVEKIKIAPYWGILLSMIFTAITSFTAMNHFVFKQNRRKD